MGRYTIEVHIDLPDAPIGASREVREQVLQANNEAVAKMGDTLKAAVDMVYAQAQIAGQTLEQVKITIEVPHHVWGQPEEE